MTMKHKSDIFNSFTCAAISTSTRTSTTAMKRTTHDVLHDRSILHWNDENRIIPTTDKDERNKTASTKTNSTTTMIHPHKHTTRNRKELQNIAWLKRFKELKQFQMQHGHCNVPQKYPENPSLGTWVNKQRMEYTLFQEGTNKSSMTLERQQLLESIGFTWAKRRGQSVWDERYQQLKEYKAKYGDCAVPTKYPQDHALGRWVSTQREQYNFWLKGDSRCKLTYENYVKLNEIGFIWRLQKVERGSLGRRL